MGDLYSIMVMSGYLTASRDGCGTPMVSIPNQEVARVLSGMILRNRMPLIVSEGMNP